jgi:uroporphyrinogen-III synthase
MVQENSKLKGKTIAITRPRGQAEELARMVEERGGKPYYVPAIEIKGPSDLKPIKNFINELQKGEVDYVVFMSVNGVRYLLTAAESLNQLPKTLEGLKKTVTIAVGPKTAQELETNQIHVNLIPWKYTSEGVVQTLRQLDVSGKTVRIPRTSSASPTLKRELLEMGASVQEVYVYESAPPDDPNLTETFFRDLKAEKIDAIIFGSTSCVKNLFQMLSAKISPEKLSGLLNSKVTVVAIGPVTAGALAEMGVKVDVMPDRHLFEEALATLAHYWNSGQKTRP